MVAAAFAIPDVPRLPEEDFPYFRPHELAEALHYYEEEGYVVIRGLIPVESCDRVRAGFDAVARHSRTPILRQKNMRYETNRFTAAGFLDNPIFNIQDLNTRTFGTFKSAALDVLTHSRVAEVTSAILGGPTKLVQSMFFEAAAGTWAHQDSYYQDSNTGLGQMTAGWYALEDIDAGAGRFFVCPRSHRRLELVRNDGRNNFASGHERYKEAMAAAIEKSGCRVVAPYMAKGDVLYWSSLTAHGSLQGQTPTASRAFMTAHDPRASDEMLQFHSRIRHQRSTPYNGMAVASLHDQDRLANRAVSAFSYAFPGVVEQARVLAMRAVIRGKKGFVSP